MPQPEIPLYRQTAGFSCGAACLAMAIAALEDVEPDRSLEFELWREATMIGVRGIDQWGLSLPPSSRGHPVTVVSEAEFTFPRWEAEDMIELREAQAERFPDEELRLFSEEELELAWWAQQDNRRRAQAAGVPWLTREPTREDVHGALMAGAVPILLVDLELLGGAWPAPHWVAVADHEDGRFLVHDPDNEGPGERWLDWEHLWGTMDVSAYQAQPAAVIVGSWQPEDG